MTDTFTPTKSGLLPSFTPFPIPCFNARFVLFLLITGVVLTGLSPISVADQTTDRVVQLHARGPIDASLRHFLTTRLKQIDTGRTDHVLIHLQSSSGRIDYAFHVVDQMEDQDVPVSVYVHGVLKGPAILLCFAADYLFLHPDARIQSGSLGNAGSGGALFPSGSLRTLTEKLAGVAERNGYAEALAKGMVDPDLTVDRIQTNGNIRFVTGETRDRLRQEQTVRVRETLTSPGNTLSLSAAEAKRVGLSTETVSTLPELLGTLNGRGLIQSLNVQLQTKRPGYGYQLLRFTTTTVPMGILLLLGTAAALIEIRQPGGGWSGASACFLLAIPVLSFAFLGLAQTPSLILLLIGLALLVLDALVIPGESMAGFCGLLPVLLAFVLAPQPSPYSLLTSTPWQLNYLFGSFSTVLISFGLGIVLFGMLLTLLPDWFKSLTLVPIRLLGPSDVDDQDRRSEQARSGSVLTPLRPIGVISADGRKIVVYTRTRYLEAGTTFDIQQVDADGIRIRLK